jgi:hypothetical protein
MPLRKSYPNQFIPTGLIDGFDSTKSFRGAFQRGANLVFDQANQGMVVARPGVTDLVDFSTTPPFNVLSPGIISVFKVIGTRVYGMVATSTTPGFDEPFCFETTTGTFIAITGVTANNVPVTQAASGQWSPPTMDMVGVNIIITHPGFDGDVPNSRFFGVIDTTNPAAPAYSSQNTGTNALPGVPIAVANYFNRAWFALNNDAYFTDQLTLVRTNASQVLKLGDSAPLTALAGLPISTNTQGVLAALIAFKGAGKSIWQITGDSALTTLAQNEIANNVGCSAPRSIQATTEGLKFMGIDGIYVINLIGTVVPLLYDARTKSQDLQSPFIEASEAQASRAAAGYNLGVYRICLDTTIAGVAVIGVDFWFDEHERRWNGPHSFPYDCTQPLADAVILSSNANPARLITSDVQQHNTTVYTDLGVPFSCSLIYALLPDQEDMQMHAVVESMIELGRASSASQYTIYAQDEFSAIIGQATITLASTGPQWGAVLWGAFVWSSGRIVSRMLTIPWTEPVVFQRMQLEIDTDASAGVALGTLSLRYQRLGYMNVDQQ